MAGKEDSWKVTNISKDLRNFFASFNFEIPEDTTHLSFATGLLGQTELEKFVKDIKSLSSEVVFCSTIGDEDIKPGTVYVLEVNVKSEGQRIIINEKNPQERSTFFRMKKEDIVKVILIRSNFLNVIDAKCSVYQKYDNNIDLESVHLQHEFEEYDEVFRSCAHKRIIQFRKLLEKYMKSILKLNIQTIIEEAANKALSREKITQLCYNSVIRGYGNVDSLPNKCYSQRTVDELKDELVETTIRSVSSSLGSELCNGILRHIEKEIKSTVNVAFTIPLHLFDRMEFDSLILSLLNSVFGIARSIVTSIVTFWQGVDVNSRSWRIEIATKIHQMILESKPKVLKELTSDITPRCRATEAHLKLILEKLEDIRERLQLTDQTTMISNWENRDIIKDKEALKNHQSIICYIAGRRNGWPVVKVLLRYYDKDAYAVFKANTNIQLVTIAARFQELSEEMKKIKMYENEAPFIKTSTKLDISQVINNQARSLYAKYSNVIGLGISNVRYDAGNIKHEACIVIYCLDKSIIPFGENSLPERIDEVPCDVREDIILFGSCYHCRDVNASPGCSIGMHFKSDSGSAGFLAKSNLSSVTGFLTAAHVAIDDLQKLYDAQVLMSECIVGRKKHKIVHPSWLDGANSELAGEVVESFCGNYYECGIDAAFVKNYEPTDREQVLMEIANENDLHNFKGTLVRKKGKTTGETEGILRSNMSSVSVDNIASPARYQFNNCYEIINRLGHPPFFKPGDSGSGVYIIDRYGKKKAVGIAFAHRLDGTTYACRIDKITHALNVTLYQEEEDEMDTS